MLVIAKLSDPQGNLSETEVETDRHAAFRDQLVTILEAWRDAADKDGLSIVGQIESCIGKLEA